MQQCVHHFLISPNYCHIIDLFAMNVCSLFIILYCSCCVALTHLTPDLLEVCDPLLMTGRTGSSDDDEEPAQRQIGKLTNQKGLNCLTCNGTAGVIGRRGGSWGDIQRWLVAVVSLLALAFLTSREEQEPGNKVGLLPSLIFK